MGQIRTTGSGLPRRPRSARASADRPGSRLSRPDNHNTVLTLLGTTGGMTWWPDCDRASASQALSVGDALYVIDLGFGATRRLAQAFNRGQYVRRGRERIQGDLTTFMANVRAVFLTHLHMDHLGDYATFLEVGARSGYGGGDKLVVIGPGSRGRLEENHSGYAGGIMTAEAGPDSPATPTPGTKRMTELLLQAFAQNFNDCARDEGYPDLTRILDVREIGDPGAIPWPAGFAPPDPGRPWTAADTCPAMEPFAVYEDDRLRVTAVLVDHFQVYPSFAYRFDTDDGSVVISGDTGPDTRGNLQRLARGADVLVHEVIDQAWIEAAFAGVDRNHPAWPLYDHVMTAHTSSADLGRVAASCEVKTLVLSHIAPGNTPPWRFQAIKRDFPGRLVVGEDLMAIGVGRPLGRLGARRLID